MVALRTHRPHRPLRRRRAARLPALLAGLLALLVCLLGAPAPAAGVVVPDPGPPPPDAVAAAEAPVGSWPPRRSALTGTRTGRVWPVDPVVIVAEIDLPDPDWLPGHRGLDLQADPGQVVRSAAEGVVAFAGRVGDRGVVVVTTGGWRASYEPVAGRVAVGEPVAAGQPLGVLDPSGGHCAAPASCLHWGLRAGDRYLDPRWLLAPARPVLLPLLRQ